MEREFNCLFCYCPLIAYECPGPYKVFTDKNGLKRKDCSDCTLPHNGYRKSWNFIQKWLERPVIWDGHEQTSPPVQRPREAADPGQDPVDCDPDDARWNRTGRCGLVQVACVAVTSAVRPAVSGLCGV